MNHGYLLYQAERTVSRAEQCAADARRGELAHALSGLLHPHRATTVAGNDCHCPAAGAAIIVPDYPPADWVTTPR
jgi:hypothetical protein